MARSLLRDSLLPASLVGALLLAVPLPAALPPGTVALLPAGVDLELAPVDQAAVCALAGADLLLRGHANLAAAPAARTLTCDRTVTAAAPLATLAADGTVTFRSTDVFVPRRAEPLRRYPFAAPPATTYRVATLSLDVTPGAFDADAAGLHNLFWFQRGPRWRGSLIGYGNLRGPGKNIALLSSNLDLPAKQMIRATRGFRPVQGATYRVEMRYDTVRRTSTMDILRDGVSVLPSPVTTATSGRLTSGAGNFFVELGFAHGGGHGPERPTYGWVYQNLTVQLIP